MAKKTKVSPDQPSLIKQEVPQMPEGYYSGDKPNPNLRAFVEEHIKENPYNPEKDDYNVPAFNKPITTTKATAIYNMHTYWSKKPHDAIRQYINHYTKPGDLVLDPFCGSGGTALAALMEGRKAIAIDRSPAATFITKNYCTPVDTEELHSAFEALKAKVQPEIDWLYETKCDRCGGKAITAYTVYSQVFQCPRCMEKVALYDCVEVESETAAGKEKIISVCPYCHKKGIEEEINVRHKKYGSVPVLISYICNNGCKPKRDERIHNDKKKNKREYFEKYDLNKVTEINKKEIPYWYPTTRMMNTPENEESWGLLWRPYLRGIDRTCDFYTKRNLWGLSAILNSIKNIIDNNMQDFFKFLFSGTLLNVSKLIQIEKSRRSPNTYYVPPVGKEIEVLSSYKSKYDSSIKALNELNNIVFRKISISTQSATDLQLIPSSSIDYVFTDPPYGSRVQYAELNFLWETWLELDSGWQSDEIIINEHRGKDYILWGNELNKSFKEIYRVLKPGRAVSVCYHDSDPQTWVLFQDIMAEIGFIVEESKYALYIETGQKTHKQTVSTNITQRDLIVTFRKPLKGELYNNDFITGVEDDRSFNEKVYSIIRDYLSINPGTTKDRIYDELISHMFRSGQLEVHDFNNLLLHVADEVRDADSSRWYLKETELEISDSAESAKEETAAGIVGEFIEKYSKNHKGLEGVHFSDLFEHFIYTVKDKPRRKFIDWLPDFFFITDDGTYRLASSEEEKQLKAEGRSKGTLRRVRRYLAFLEQGVAVPDRERPNDATLAEWIRHCKRSGLYAQGKLLYEKGGINIDALPEELMVGVEEDYQVCARMLSRDTEKKARKSK